LRFAVGVFSNLTGDHLDYHHDVESYLLAKKRLFDGLGVDAVAAVNRDDPAGERMVADCPARIIWYGIEGGPGDRRTTDAARPSACEVIARIVEQSAAGTRFRLIVRPDASSRGLAVSGERECDIFTPLIGNHNVQNCLAAAAAAIGAGLPLEMVARGLAAVQVVPGRLQRVPTSGSNGRAGGFSVFVDYAHTDDALKNVLSTLKPFATGGKLIVLFGCGGDRDRSKRPRMARVVAEWADCIMLTSDNPRTEDPSRIIDDVMAGFASDDRGRVYVEPDRRKAIGTALGMAQAGDVVLLAGKGHETYQIIGRQKFPFDDATIAAEVLKAISC
jgi:UDP-N-acetylmuramoyl-L-alanyl-D-glutamate--2,6-diaminopimelate ligase